jgi:hypothetical protein
VSSGRFGFRTGWVEEVEQVFANDPMDLGADVVEGEERYTGWATRRLRVPAFDASELLDL